jgi:hemerythrin superfamily protein
MTVSHKKSPAASASTAADAIALLTKDHRDVKKLFTTYQKLADEEAPAEQRLAIAQEICEALTMHATVEEEIFYPALRGATTEADDELDEAEVEHNSVKELVAQIKAMEPDDALYNAKVKVLGEYVDHHASEEEGEMFPKAKESDMDLEAIGQQIKDRKEELQTAVID